MAHDVLCVEEMAEDAARSVGDCCRFIVNQKLLTIFPLAVTISRNLEEGNGATDNAIDI
jgi:hypothetical protein